MNRINSKIRYLIHTIVCTILLIASFTMSFIISYTDLLNVHPFVGMAFLVLVVAFSIGLVFSVKGYIDYKNFEDQLKLENQYLLGKKSSFYNNEAFQKRVLKYSRRKSNRRYLQYMLAFTASTIKVTSNSFHNEMITTLNRNIAEYLTTFFMKSRKGRNDYRRHVFGFNRGVFLIYLFVKEEKNILDLVDIISSNLYRIVEENNIKVFVRPNFGIRRVEKGENIIALMEDAFIARSVAEDTFEPFAFFDPSYKSETSLSDIDEIEQAINNNEFVIYYQPKYSLREKKFVSVEALARWDSPKYGFLTPAMFIDKAENAGLISAIDNYIFERALMDISEARRKGRRVLPVSVNFSLHEFYSVHFLKMVDTLLKKYQVPPHFVEIEITETTSQANQFLSISIIKKLKEMGIRVLMDDFGIGYSGIDNLRKIPFDAIKIDKSFTDLLISDEKTRSIVKLITELGHLNDLEVIIEGVDNKEQIDILRKIKIDTIQGFYYAKPMPLKDYDLFLKANQFEKKENDEQ